MDQGVSIINSTINLAAKTAVNEDENLILFWKKKKRHYWVLYRVCS